MPPILSCRGMVLLATVSLACTCLYLWQSSLPLTPKALQFTVRTRGQSHNAFSGDDDGSKDNSYTALPDNDYERQPAPDNGVCAHLWSRQECGYFGITKDGCLQRQCCWAPALAPVPWCFEKSNEVYVCTADVVSRRDCGYLGIEPKQCMDRNCCWDPVQDNLNSPFCFFKQHVCKGYRVISDAHGPDSIIVHLELNGGKEGCARYGQDIERLEVQVDMSNANAIRVKILDRDHPRYQIPEGVLPDSSSTSTFTRSSSSNNSSNVNHDTDGYASIPRQYNFSFTSNPFTFAITRISNGEKVFDSNVAGMDSLIYEDQYLELSTTLPTEDPNIFGLGEVVAGFRRDARGTRQTLWARDSATPVDENLYGSHPFYLEMRDGHAHGVFLRNSNGMDVIISPSKITYKVIGGVLDFSIFMGDTPLQVIDQYTQAIGRPAMPPAWALGFHHSRYGFKDLDQVKAVIEGYKQAQIPLDTIWLDIDYMDAFKDFTYDPKRFPQQDLKSFAEDLHQDQQYLAMIVDPGIATVPGYGPYQSGLQQDVFLKTKDGKAPIVGRVWPGKTVFPDFMDRQRTWPWWKKLLGGMKRDVGVDGIWIDMNEVASWCNGECSPEENVLLDGERQQQQEQQRSIDQDGFKGVSQEELEQTILDHLNDENDDDVYPDGRAEPGIDSPWYDFKLQYAINNGGRGAPLSENTVSETAIGHDGLRLYDTHNLYGHMESMATRSALVELEKNTRPFVLSRSTFPGTGAHAAHWTGDNWSEWSHLYFSIPGILNFGLFGIPFTGADICGFNGNTTEELCQRWHQLGALYPFSRNHNAIGQVDQEPFLWPDSVLGSTKQALEIRYSLLPYLYSLFSWGAQESGAPVWQPLFFQFPNDGLTYKMDHQFLLGDSILVTPALYKGLVEVKGYFPGNGRWFDLVTMKCVMEQEILLSIENGQSGKPTTMIGLNPMAHSTNFNPHQYLQQLERQHQQQVHQRILQNPHHFDSQDLFLDTLDQRFHRYAFLPARLYNASLGILGDSIPMHLMGGKVVPQQRPKLTIAETRLQPMTLLVALDHLGQANGKMVVDDGKSIEQEVQAIVSWQVNQEVSNDDDDDEEEDEVENKARKMTLKNSVQWTRRQPRWMETLDSIAHLKWHHSNRIEKVVVMGVNFGRLGGESDMRILRDKNSRDTFGSKFVMESDEDNVSRVEKVNVVLMENSSRTVRTLKMSRVKWVEIDGVILDLLDSEQDDQDGAGGSERSPPKTTVRLNPETGAVVISGLNLNLVKPWTIRWELE